MYTRQIAARIARRRRASGRRMTSSHSARLRAGLSLLSLLYSTSALQQILQVLQRVTALYSSVSVTRSTCRGSTASTALQFYSFTASTFYSALHPPSGPPLRTVEAGLTVVGGFAGEVPRERDLVRPSGRGAWHVRACTTCTGTCTYTSNVSYNGSSGSGSGSGSGSCTVYL